MTDRDNYLFEHLIDYLSEPVFVKDNEHRIIIANQAFYDLFQTEPANVIGYTLAEAVPPNEREHFMKVDREVLDTGISDFREESLTVDGKTHTIMTSKKRYTNEDGEHYLIGSIQDITELKSVEAQLKEEKLQLESALKEIKTLKEILPICSYCQKIRDDEGQWQQLEEYVTKYTGSSFSHGICGNCAKEHFPDYTIDSKE